MKYKILESTAPDIPIEDIQINEKMHAQIEKTDVYKGIREHE